MAAAPITTTTDIDAVLRRIREHSWSLVLGRERRETSETYKTVDPATEHPLASVPEADRSTIHQAVEIGHAAAGPWGRMPPRDRARKVRVLVDVLRDHRDEIAALDAIDSGNPLPAAQQDLDWAINLIELACDSAILLEGRTLPLTADHVHLTERVPYGVVGRIIPFNHPALFTAAKIAPPLVAGNAVVLKAPPQTPLAPLRIGELFSEVLPAGVLSVVTGSGIEPGDSLVRHPHVERIAFIGSKAAGLAIQRAAAETGVKNVTLELGGKNPMLALPDADPSAVAAGVVKGMNFRMSQGQSCGSTSRLLVHESLHDEVVERIQTLVQQIRIGHPLDPGVEMGPLVSQAQYDKSMRYIDIATDEGAQLVTGGRRPAGLDRGFFIEPTVFTDVRAGMRIEQEEVFGPVLSVMTFRDLDTAIEAANGVEYGLTASVWTNDVSQAHRLARQLDVGYVWINDAATHYLGAPFGGHKSSGVGTEEDANEVLSFTRTRTVHVVTSDGSAGGRA